MWNRLILRIRYWRSRAQREALLREEIETHLDMTAQRLQEEGRTPSDARAEARRRFGNVLAKQEESRETWIARWLTDLAHDAAFAVRTIRKQPAFAAIPALSAALGIGACSLMFGLANHALLRTLPVDDPSRLMSLSGVDLRSGKAGISVSYPDIEDLRKAASFEQIAVFFPFLPAVISTGGEPQRYWGAIVSANYFDTVRPRFAVGRGFDAEHDDHPGAPPSVVLSHSLWRSRFGGDPSIAGRNVDLNGRPARVAGVLAEGFRGTEPMIYSDFWVPLSMTGVLAQAGMGGDRLRDRGNQWLLAAGRLRDGVTPAAAASEMDAIGKRLNASYPATNRDRAFHVERAGQIQPGLRKMAAVVFALLLGAAILLLFTACANVANLLLARASARQKEIATRLAIGAGRFRLIRQLLTESLVLALLGGAAGYALAHTGALLLSRLRLPVSMPVDLTVSLDYRVLVFCVLLSTVTSVIFGLVPALRATSPNLTSAIGGGQRSSGHGRRFGLRQILVVSQVAICTVLLTASGLFLRSLVAAGRIDPGFANSNILLVTFDPALSGYPPARTGRIVSQILEAATAIPGVESATVTNALPLSLEGTQNGFVPIRPPGAAPSATISADIYGVAPGFFRTLGIALLDGEDFRYAAAGDIAIVNHALAAKAFPGEHATGRQIRYMGRTIRITGIAATHKSRTIGEDPRPCIYLPLRNEMRGNDSLTGFTLMLATRGDPAGYAEHIRRAIRQLDPSLAIFNIGTMESHLSRALMFPRATASLFGLAGLMGVLIATAGIYGVMSFTVSRMTKEIGMRMALGATRGSVLRMILTGGMLLAGIGCAAGLAAAAALGRVTASFLYGVSSNDALTFATVPVFLLCIASIACLVPARRAASVDPWRSLRCD